MPQTNQRPPLSVNFDGSYDSAYASGNKPDSSGAARIFFENFEGALQAGSALANNAVVATTATSYSGSKCARVNLKVGATDSLVATPTNNATYEYNGTLLQALNPTVRTIRWKFRFDDATWDGALFTTRTEPHQVDLKGGYFGLVGFRVTGFYIGLRGGTAGALNFGDNDTSNARGDQGWENSAWAVAGRTNFYIQTGHSFGSGTGWHDFTMTVDASHADYNQVRIWIDGYLATHPTYAVDGIVRAPKTWNIETFSTCYTGTNNVNNSVNRTEVACGIQYDDIEIFSGAI